MCRLILTQVPCAGFLLGGERLFFAFFFCPPGRDAGRPDTRKRRCFPISVKELLINEEIHASEVRLIGEDGEQIGIVKLEEAKSIALSKDLDLVMISPNAAPPVCRIMDYGKYRFEKIKKEKEARKNQQVIKIKEIQLSCTIDKHDFDTRVNHAHRFLAEGNKVKVILRFKGREMTHLDNGREVVARFQEACADAGTAERKPVLEGRFLSIVIAPNKS
ncbi:MAG: translation initiation factor IF-3 [Clostridia bacterium]|nr:translation initiation factor IF-3 [Clostridia bacterium]